MQPKPTMHGLVALEATGSSYSVGLLVDTIDGLKDWELASEITKTSSDLSETVSLLLWHKYDPSA